jgi:rare lipoprotein A
LRTRDQGFRIQAALVSLVLATAIAGCSTKPGGYYKGDGPGGPPPVNLDRVADAKPKVESLHPSANNPYSALGKKYAPYRSLKPHRERGLASWYGRGFHGKRTASGEPYDMYAMTAAHTILPIPSYARVTHLGNRRSVIVRINDRGPFRTDRIIDLSYAAAHRLGYVQAGSARVEVEAILPGKTSAVGEPGSPRPEVACAGAPRFVFPPPTAPNI